LDALEGFRREKDAACRPNPDSLLDPEQRRAFPGLRYFPRNPALDLVVDPEELETKTQIEMQTTTGKVLRTVGASEVRGRGPAGQSDHIPQRRRLLAAFDRRPSRQGDVRQRTVPRTGDDARRPDARRFQPRVQPVLRLQLPLVMPDHACGEPPSNAEQRRRDDVRARLTSGRGNPSYSASTQRRRRRNLWRYRCIPISTANCTPASSMVENCSK
jgi:hypothetical protein